MMRLLIDPYLDKELEQERCHLFDLHIEECEACGQELEYARRFHRELVSLPALDCRDQAFEPIDRLMAGHRAVQPRTAKTSLVELFQWLTAAPGVIKYGFSVLLIAVLLNGLLAQYRNSSVEVPAGPDTALIDPAAPSEAEVRRAFEELQVAIDYLEQVSQRAGVLIEDRFLEQQLKNSINASLRISADPSLDGNNINGPI